MAYINQEMKQVIANNLKPILAKYNVKATLKIRNNMAIDLTLRAGALDIKNDWIVFKREWKGEAIEVTEPYLVKDEAWLKNRFKGDTLDFLKAASQAMKAAGWYDNSDGQIDYFDTAYYWDIVLEQYKCIKN